MHKYRLISTDTVYICVRLSLRRLTVQLYFRRYYSWETFSWFESAESLGWLAGLLGKYRRQELRGRSTAGFIIKRATRIVCCMATWHHGEEPDCNCPSSASTHSAAWVVSRLASINSSSGWLHAKDASMTAEGVTARWTSPVSSDETRDRGPDVPHPGARQSSRSA